MAAWFYRSWTKDKRERRRPRPTGRRASPGLLAIVSPGVV
jgi:hypothetical protein